MYYRDLVIRDDCRCCGENLKSVDIQSVGVCDDCRTVIRELTFTKNAATVEYWKSLPIMRRF